ncbi:MAG: hypothetical protein QOE55_7658 [Acidobacteriaceae bacterium]|nr:hypothetical protein [Acidobacteriaceae bacterium]
MVRISSQSWERKAIRNFSPISFLIDSAVISLYTQTVAFAFATRMLSGPAVGTTSSNSQLAPESNSLFVFCPLIDMQRPCGK